MSSKLFFCLPQIIFLETFPPLYGGKCMRFWISWILVQSLISYTNLGNGCKLWVSLFSYVKQKKISTSNVVVNRTRRRAMCTVPTQQGIGRIGLSLLGQSPSCGSDHPTSGGSEHPHPVTLTTHIWWLWPSHNILSVSPDKCPVLSSKAYCTHHSLVLFFMLCPRPFLTLLTYPNLHFFA